MKIEGEVVTEAQIAAGLAAMNNDGGGFGYNQVKAAMIAAGCPADTAYRAADRLLQRERRAGRIEFVRGKGWFRTEDVK
jgi:hypothetical protein